MKFVLAIIVCVVYVVFYFQEMSVVIVGILYILKGAGVGAAISIIPATIANHMLFGYWND